MQQLPDHASVVVIGGGVMGCSTLYHLAKRGVTDAILLERNKLTSGTTWHSAAQVRALRSTRNMTDLIRYSISLYTALEAETGQQTGWINKGSLSIATNADRLIHIRRQEALAKLFGVEATSVDPCEAKERWPLMNASDVIGAVWSPGDGRVSPSDLCAALIKGARARGARVFEDVALAGVLTERGRITGIETARGTVRCDALALCTGLWSRHTAALAGADVPVWPCEHFYLLTKPVEGLEGNVPTLSDHDGHLYIRDDSGGLLVGCFEPMGKAIDPARLGPDFAFQLLPEDWDHFEPMMANALHRLPVLETAQVKMLLNGPESFTPDGSFLLGEAAETQGRFLGCGMNSVGVATGGGAGMALAHCIAEGHLPGDLHEVDPKRFSGAWNDVTALATRVPEVLGRHYEIAYPGRQWSSARCLALGPLHARHAAAGAHFGQIGASERPLFFNSTREPGLGFDRPEWFAQVGYEVSCAHTRAALFDLSSFGKIDVEGPDACSFLERVCANKIDRPPGTAIYTVMLNERGGIESDLTVVRLDENRFRLTVGSTALKRDMAWLRRARLEGEDVSLEDRTDDVAMLGLMGPESGSITESLGAPELSAIGYFRSREASLAGVQVRATRMSYVGEPGWEISCAAQDVPALYDNLRTAGAHPAGLLAQTSMRIEKGFLAYGHELDSGVTPLEAGLDFTIAWSKSFTGRAALDGRRMDGVQKRIVMLAVEDKTAVPLGNEPVRVSGEIVGKTTSAAYGYRIDHPVALALVDASAAKDGALLAIDVAGDELNARVSLNALFDPSGARMRGSS